MKIVFTRHAKNRMRWRSIGLDEALQTVWTPDKKQFLESDKFHYYKSINRKYLRATVVLEIDKIVVISVVNKKD